MAKAHIEVPTRKRWTFLDLIHPVKRPREVVLIELDGEFFVPHKVTNYEGNDGSRIIIHVREPEEG